MDTLEQSVKDISNNHYEYLFNLQNVNSVGYGYKYINNTNTLEPCINVFVNNKIDKKHLTKNNIIPKTYMGIKTDVIESGEIVAYNQYLKTRPLQSGCNIAILNSDTYGTMCCVVKKKVSVGFMKYVYDYYILSNNHVLCEHNKVPIGSFVIQPLFSDGEKSTISDAVATLDDFVPLKYIKSNKNFTNYVDCAIAKITNKSLISNKVVALPSSKITSIGKAKLGMDVKKSGSVTDVTEGTVTSLYVSTIINYSENEKAFFKEQMFLNLKSSIGDSGSAILTLDDKLIGLHSSGNANIQLSVCNDINLVFKELKVNLYTGED